MSEKKCNVEKQVKVEYFIKDTIQSNLKTTKKMVEPTSHFKKWLEALPQEGSEAAPTDHQCDLGSYLSFGFWKIIIPSESLNKGSHARRFQDVHFLLARF